MIILRLRMNSGFITSRPGHDASDFVACEQQMHRPAYASTQSDQRLCYSLSGMYGNQVCTMQTFLHILVSVAEQACLSHTW